MQRSKHISKSLCVFCNDCNQRSIDDAANFNIIIGATGAVVVKVEMQRRLLKPLINKPIAIN